MFRHWQCEIVYVFICKSRLIQKQKRKKRNPLPQMIQTQVTLFLATHPLQSTRVMNCEMAALKGHLRCFHVQRRGDQEKKKKENTAWSSKIITVSLPSWNHVTCRGFAWVMQYHVRVISTNDTHVQSEELFLIWPWLLTIRPQIKTNLFTSLFPEAKVCCFNHSHLISGKLDLCRKWIWISSVRGNYPHHVFIPLIATNLYIKWAG